MFKLCIVLISLFLSAAVFAAMRDPTQPPGYEAPASGRVTLDNLQVTSVIFSPKRKLVYVNGQYLKEGQTIQNVKVVNIKPGEAKFRDLSTGKDFTVPVFDDSIKISTGEVKE